MDVLTFCKRGLNTLMFIGSLNNCAAFFSYWKCCTSANADTTLPCSTALSKASYSMSFCSNGKTRCWSANLFRLVTTLSSQFPARYCATIQSSPLPTIIISCQIVYNSLCKICRRCRRSSAVFACLLSRLICISCAILSYSGCKKDYCQCYINYSSTYCSSDKCNMVEMALVIVFVNELKHNCFVCELAFEWSFMISSSSSLLSSPPLSLSYNLFFLSLLCLLWDVLIFPFRALLYVLLPCEVVLFVFIALISASCSGWRNMSCAILSFTNKPPCRAWHLLNSYGYNSRIRFTRKGQSRCASTAKGKCFAKSKTHTTGSFTLTSLISPLLVSSIFVLLFMWLLFTNNDIYSSSDDNRLSHTKQLDKL